MFGEMILISHLQVCIRELARINEREFEIYGDRILEGGDMYEIHHKFLESTAPLSVEI